MFERFTNLARRAIVLAQEESRLLNHNYIGTEHLLLGLLRVDEGAATQVLEAFGASLEGVRASVEEVIGRGNTPPSGHIPFTPRAKEVLDLSLREALQLSQNHIGTEHILLGLIREGEGVAAQILVKMGIDLISARQKVMELLHGSGSSRRTVGATESFTPSGEMRVESVRVSLNPVPVEMPVCPGCSTSLEGKLMYRVLEAREGGGGDQTRHVVFLFCMNCGLAIEDWMLPKESS